MISARISRVGLPPAARVRNDLIIRPTRAFCTRSVTAITPEQEQRRRGLRLGRRLAVDERLDEWQRVARRTRAARRAGLARTAPSSSPSSVTLGLDAFRDLKSFELSTHAASDHTMNSASSQRITSMR